MMRLKDNKCRPPKRNTWRRLLHFEQCEERLLLSVSPSGDPASELGLLAGDVSGKPAVRIRIDTINAAGTPISEASVGEEFLVNVYVQDVRENARGVFATYLDLLYDPNLVLAGDAVQFGQDFPNGRAIDASIPGIIDEVGAFAAFQESGPIEVLLLSMPFVATRPGRVDFIGEQPDYVGSMPLVYGHDYGVPFDEIDFGRAALNVVARDLPALGSFSTSAYSTPNSAASAFQAFDSFPNLDQRLDSTERLSESYVERYFASTHATSPLATNGGFNDVDRLWSSDWTVGSISVADELGAGVRRAELDAAPINFDSQLQDSRFVSPSETRLMAVNGVRRIAEDRFYSLADITLYVSTGRSDGLASSPQIRAFTSAELPHPSDADSPLRPKTESGAESISEANQQGSARPPQVASDLSDSASAIRDDSVRESDGQVVGVITPTGNGGYVNLAVLQRVALPKPVDMPNISTIQIARTDSRPRPGEVARISKGASAVALTSLTWQLRVDSSRGVSLSFEIGDESQAARAIGPDEMRDAAPRLRSDGGRSTLPAQEAADSDSRIILPDAKTASFDVGDGAENVQDERRHYLAVSPLIVIVAGSLLVTEHWQKLQPRKEKRQPC